MRFVLGLIIGAAAVLLLAEGIAGDGNWRARLDAAVVRAERWVEHAREMAVGNPVTPPLRAVEEPPAVPAPATEAVPSVAAVERPAPAVKASGAEPEAHPDAAAAAAPPEAADRGPASTPGVEHAEPSMLRLADTALAAAAPEPVAPIEPATQPIPRPPDPQPIEPAERERPSRSAAIDAGETVAAATPGSQAVWVPFHSEMSANGFAARLRRSLDHPFEVVREGPGHYQVVFPYQTEPQREALLVEAAEATGLPL